MGDIYDDDRFDLDEYLSSLYSPHHRDDEVPDVSALDLSDWVYANSKGLCSFCGDGHKRQECPNDPSNNYGIN